MENLIETCFALQNIFAGFVNIEMVHATTRKAGAW